MILEDTSSSLYHNIATIQCRRSHLLKDRGAKGDGQTDDTAALQAALLANANCKVTYFPHGVYLVTDTLYVPPGSRIVGEVSSNENKHYCETDVVLVVAS